jgi:hypothetical protein
MNRCEAQVLTGYRLFQCHRNGRYEENGKHYCGTHAPSKKAEKRAKKQEAFTRDLEARVAANKAAQEEREKTARRAALFPTLLAALKAVQRNDFSLVDIAVMEAESCDVSN